jgi:hypothetical protein
MGSWYWIGVSAGLGAAAGVLLAGFTARIVVLAAALGAAAGLGLGAAVDAWQPGGWGDLVAGIAGGMAGSVGAAQIVKGALRRGGTGGATGLLVAGVAVAVAAVAFVPALGYVEAAGLPLLASRIRRRLPERYAGLRTLARDE